MEYAWRQTRVLASLGGSTQTAPQRFVRKHAEMAATVPRTIRVHAPLCGRATTAEHPFAIKLA